MNVGDRVIVIDSPIDAFINGETGRVLGVFDDMALIEFDNDIGGHDGGGGGKYGHCWYCYSEYVQLLQRRKGEDLLKILG